MGELFCGAGGMSFGAATVSDGGFEHAWANDCDTDACRTFAQNVPGADGKTVLRKDVRDLDIAALPRIDVLAFGFPCNDFSKLGRRRGLSGMYGPLYRYGVRALEAHAPLAFVAENVQGLASDAGGSTLRRMLRELAAAGPGYSVVTHLYRAEEYGVPQARKRIVIVGVRSDLGIRFRVPAPTTKDMPQTADTALSTPPIRSGASNHEISWPGATVTERLRHIPPGGNSFTADLPPT